MKKITEKQGKSIEFIPKNGYSKNKNPKSGHSTENKTGNETESESTEGLAKIMRIKNYLFKHYDIRFNTVSNQIEAKPKDSSEPYSVINENDLLFELYEKKFPKPKEEFKILINSKHTPKYDPFFEYFETLPEWNQEHDPDYIEQLANYVRTDNQKWFVLMFRKFLVRVAAQATNRIPFNKQCLTFVGKQNDGKTSFFDFLVPPKLKNYCKKHYDFGKKEGKISLVQNFLINLDELASFEFQRKASFVASTNQYEFLTDETGNVRWLVFNVLEINHDNGKEKGYSKNIDIDLVWSQAYHLLNNGFEYEMNRDEIKQQEILNKLFLRKSEEMEAISHIYLPASEEDENVVYKEVKEIQTELNQNNRNNFNCYNIGRALKAMGFTCKSIYSPEYKWSVNKYLIKYYKN
ncbi:MAG: virulence-associated E family protein [Spirosomaceae bacterium]|nr:virulence-associated E family protein [Spirosomataceae bacterium]